MVPIGPSIGPFQGIGITAVLDSNLSAGGCPDTKLNTAGSVGTCAPESNRVEESNKRSGAIATATTESLARGITPVKSDQVIPGGTGTWGD